MEVWLKNLSLLIQRDLDSVAKELEMFADENAIWQVLPGVTNSGGNLTLHVCGNLNHYIGHLLGGTDYMRDRDHEFASKSESRDQLLLMVSNTKNMLTRVMPKISKDQLAARFPESVGGAELPCARFLMHLATHLAHHLGQLGYLRRMLTEDNVSSHPQSIRAIAG